MPRETADERAPTEGREPAEEQGEAHERRGPPRRDSIRS
jgi:hypothetical protein